MSRVTGNASSRPRSYPAFWEASEPTRTAWAGAVALRGKVASGGRNTAAATTEVHKPVLSPVADWVTRVVLIMSPVDWYTWFRAAQAVSGSKGRPAGVARAVAAR